MRRIAWVVTTAWLMMGAAIHHDAFSALLARHVHDGRVNYVALRQGRDALDAYVSQLVATDPSGLPTDASRMAFWLNGYNALVLQSVLDHAPEDLDTLRRFNVKRDVAGFFTERRFQIGGEVVTLDAMERNKLRRFGDPRIHFALVCASSSCPDLQPEAYVPERLEEQLTSATRHFLSQPKGAQIDYDSRTLWLSSIFRWYRQDIGDVYSFLRRYGPPGIAGIRSLPLFRIRYLPYDWTLNSQ